MNNKKMKYFLIATCIILSFLIIGFSSLQKHSKLNYSMVDTPISQGFETIQNAQQNHEPLTIVLRKTGCKYCIQDKKIIVSNVENGRLAGNKILVLNVAKMNHSQIKYLKTKFTKILYRKKYIATPTVFVAQYKNHQWKVLMVENTGNLKIGRAHV